MNSHSSHTADAAPYDDGTAVLAAFPSTSYDQWRQASEQSLRGASFESQLVTHTAEGIDLQPMYWPQDVHDLPFLDSVPGFPPYVRGASALGALSQPWEIAQSLPYADSAAWNRAATHDLERGQTALTLPLDRASSKGLDPDRAQPNDVGSAGLSVATVDDLHATLKGVQLETTPLYVQSGSAALPVAALLFALARRRGVDITQLRGVLASDPLGVLAHTGSLPCSLEQAYNELAQLTAWAAQHAPKLATIGVDTTPYHESGGSAVQELAFGVATAVDYLRGLQTHGLTIDMIAPRLRFSFAAGGHVFVEIARLRAARSLWATVVAAFGGSPDSQRMRMHVRTGRWNKTRHDPYVNILRATVEAFAAVLGGCDSLEVGCFDQDVREPDELGRRIARNTQLIVRDESHIARVADPVGGSYYVEALTDALAREAWALFQELERSGGMARAMKAGVVQRQVAATAAQRDGDLATRKAVLVGTNMYADPHEKPLDPHSFDRAAFAQQRRADIGVLRAQEREGVVDALGRAQQAQGAKRVDAALEAALLGATLGELAQALRVSAAAIAVEPLRIYRGAEPFERIRALADDFAARTGTRPLAFLANMGPPAQHKARADFSTGLLAAAGIDVIGNQAFATADEAARAAVAAQAPIVVICSTDATYGELVPPLAQQIKAKRPATRVLLAGDPRDQRERYTAAGVDDFVHLRVDAVQVLERLLQAIGGGA